MRVEPVEQSSNPLAMIAKSYAGLDRHVPRRA